MNTDSRIAWRPLGVIIYIANQMKYHGLKLNERYLHHYFSRLIPRNGYLNLAEDGALFVHPEWPTYKKQTTLAFGRYRQIQRKYYPHPQGTAGFIDFAFGNYNNPFCGLEFSLKYGWSHEEIMYDFVKLMDAQNPFKVAISYNVIFRKKRLVQGTHLSHLEIRMQDAIEEAVTRLQDQVCDESRALHFIISEIDNTNRRHWHYNQKTHQFSHGLPLS